MNPALSVWFVSVDDVSVYVAANANQIFVRCVKNARARLSRQHSDLGYSSVKMFRWNKTVIVRRV